MQYEEKIATKWEPRTANGKVVKKKTRVAKTKFAAYRILLIYSFTVGPWATDIKERVFLRGRRWRRCAGVSSPGHRERRGRHCMVPPTRQTLSAGGGANGPGGVACKNEIRTVTKVILRQPMRTDNKRARSKGNRTIIKNISFINSMKILRHRACSKSQIKQK